MERVSEVSVKKSQKTKQKISSLKLLNNPLLVLFNKKIWLKNGYQNIEKRRNSY